MHSQMKQYLDSLQCPPAIRKASYLLVDSLKGNLAIGMINMDAITLLRTELL